MTSCDGGQAWRAPAAPRLEARVGFELKGLQ
jgi:hypothetical protein